MYRELQPRTMEDTYRTFIKFDHVLSQKASLNTFQKPESDHNVESYKLRSIKVTGSSMYVCKLRYLF